MSDNEVVRLSVYVDEDAHVNHRPLYTEIVHRAHAAGLAGATVLRGVEGYGAGSRLHTTRLLSLAEHLPMVIQIVDDADRIEDFLPTLADLAERGIATVESVRRWRFGGPAS